MERYETCDITGTSLLRHVLSAAVPVRRRGDRSRRPAWSNPAVRQAAGAAVEALEGRQLFSAVSWIGGSGDWGVGANWSSGSVPTSSDDVTIDVAGSTPTITISSGTRSVKSLTMGENLTISGGSLGIGSGGASIVGNVTVAGGTLNLSGAWSNAGTLAVNSGTANLGGTFTTAGLGTFARSGGTVNLTGTMDNSGTTFTLDGNTGSWNLDGTILGGTVDTAAGYSLTPDGGTFDGVTLDTNITVPHTKSINIKNGLTLLNGSYIFANSSSTSATRINLKGTQTISGNGLLFVGGSSSGGVIRVQGDSAASPATVTLASGVSLGGRGEVESLYAGDTLVNHGTIYANISSSFTLAIAPSVLHNAGTIRSTSGMLRISADSWTNTGTIDVAGGTLQANNNWSSSGDVDVSAGTLQLFGTFSLSNVANWTRTGGTVNLYGTLVNTGNTFTINNSTGSWTVNGGTIVGGTLDTADGQTLNIASSGTLDGVTLEADLTIPNLKTLNITNGLTLNGTINVYSTSTSSGSNTRLVADGTQTIAGIGEINLGGTSSNAYLHVLGSPSAATLTIGSGVTVRGRGFIASSTGTNANYLVNQGTISADRSGQYLKVTNLASITNEGEMSSVSGGHVSVQGSAFSNGGQITVNDASQLTISSPTYTNAGRVDVFGTGSATIGSETVAGATVSVTQTTITFDWDQVTVGLGGSYLIEISTDGENFSTYDTLSSLGSTYQATGLTAGTNYWFRVSALNTDGSIVVYSSGQAATAP